MKSMMLAKGCLVLAIGLLHYCNNQVTGKVKNVPILTVRARAVWSYGAGKPHMHACTAQNMIAVSEVMLHNTC